MEKKEPVKITKKITGYKVVTPEETENVFVDLLDTAITGETIKPLDSSLFERIEALRIKAELKRPRQLPSETYRLKPPHAEHAIYVHISDIIYQNKKYPYEIFFNCKNPANIMWVSAITLLLSEAFREAIIGTKDLSKIVNNLKEVCDANGGYFAVVGEKKKHVGSLIAEVGYILEEHIRKCNAWNYSQSSHERPPLPAEIIAAFDTRPRGEVTWQDGEPTYNLPKVTNPCPDCGSQLAKQAGCDICTNCGYSKCS